MGEIEINCTDFFNLNPLPSWIYEIATFQILEVNAAAIELYGYSRKEFLSLTLRDLGPKEDFSKLDDFLRNIDTTEGKIQFGILSHQKKNGNLIQMDIVGHKVNFNNKKCILNISQDVTEKQVQLAKLIKTEEQLKEAANIAKLGYWRLELATNTITWTEEVSQIWGGKNKKKQSSLQSVLDTIYPNDLENLLQRYKKSIKDDGFHDAIHRIILPDSSVKWVHEIASVKSDENGVPISLEGTVQDITERKEEEERLRLLENVIKNTKDAIVITEAEPIENSGPKIIYVNQAFTKMTGYTAEEIIGKTPRILQGPNSDKNELEKLKTALKNREPCEITVLNNKKNGDEFWVKLSVTPITNETGAYTNWISIQKNVTKEKQTQLKKDLLAKISTNFKDENSLISSTKKVCQTICDFGNFDFAEIWLPNLDKTKINLISKICNSKIAEKFYKSSFNKTSILPQEGIPGLVWQKKSSVLWSDVSENLDFIRKDAAKSSGINTVLGIPLLFNNEVIGIMIVGTKNNSKYLINHQTTLEDLKDFIGSEINRKKLENDLNHLYDAVPDLICVTDLNGTFLKINKAGCEILGHQEDEILHYNYEKFIHPEDKNISNSDLKNLNNGNKTLNFQNRYIKKNGEIVWLSWTSNINLEEGLIYASAKNITQEIRLLDLTTQTSKLARIGSWEVDLINNKVYWTDMVHELHETDPKNHIPSVDSGINFYRDDFKDLVAKNVSNCIEFGTPFNFEAVLVTAKNNELWIKSIGNAEFVNGKCLRVFGSFQDINERKQTELRYQSLADNLPGVAYQYLIHPDGTDSIRYVTKGSYELWGYSPDEVLENVNKVWKQIELGGSLERIKQTVLDSMTSKSKWTATWRNVKPNGEVKTYLGLGTPSYLIDGTTLFNSVVLDVTYEEKNKELLEQTSKLARIGSWEVDLISNQLFWSDMVHEIHETSVTDFNPNIDTAINFYRKDFQDLITCRVQDCIKNGKPYNFEAVLITAKNNEIWIRTHGNAEIINGKVIRIYGSIQDINKQKLNEIALQESLKNLKDYKLALDQSASITIANKNGVIIDVNDNFCKLSKYSREELVGNTHKIINSTYHSKAFFKVLWDTIKAGKVWRGEVKNRAKDGTLYWALSTVIPFLDENMQPFQYMAIRIDITEKKLADERILKILNEKNKILESIGDAFFAVDKYWRVTYWNKQAEVLVGKNREEIVGENIREVFNDGINFGIYKSLKKSLETKETLNIEIYSTTLKKWLEIAAYPSKEGLSVYFKDISQRKEADLKLIEANERFGKVAEATSDAIYEWGIIDDSHYWGAGFETILGYDLKTVKPSSKLWLDQIHPEDVERVRKSIFDAIADPTILKWAEEYRFIKRDGTILFVIDKGIFIRNSERKVEKMFGSIADLTKQKAQELELIALNESLRKYAKDLELSNEQLEQFAFIASHDLQEPLRMISSFMDLLKRKYETQLDEKGMQYIHFATDGARRMKKIILDLLEYSRAGKINETPETFAVMDIILEYEFLRKQLIIDKNVELNVGNMPIIQCFKSPFIQTLHGLIDNALKYSRKDIFPRVNIYSEEDENYFKIFVQDNGIGIDPKFHEKIFVIFQRLHNKETYEGTGIGLAIAKKQVESWGGIIGVISNINEGATFFFTIPKSIEKS